MRSTARRSTWLHGQPARPRTTRRSQAATASTTARGYGYAHKQARHAALARLRDGDPCARCHQPMYRSQDLELDHDDTDRTRYLGLSHARCNRAAGGHKSASNQRARAAQPNPSRDW